MIITFTNVIGAIRNAISSVITTNLKMWLGFETSETLGREEVVNGDFASNTWWTVETPDAEISNGKVNFNTAKTNYGIFRANLLTTGKQYKVVFTIDSYTSGAVHLNIGGVVVNSYNSEDTFTAYITGGGSNVFGIQSDNGGATLSINNVSVKELTQITPDKSGNNNVGELFTGKALEFDGDNDTVGFSFTTPIKSAVFWLNPLDTGYENIIHFGGGFSSLKSIRSNGNIIQTAGLSSVSVYVNGVSTTSVPVNQWSRVVVNFALLTPSELKFGYAPFAYGYIQLSNVQFYNENLSLDDIAYDYANPQNLVTDRSGTSIGLSNLKGYWHLSEGAGSLTYDSSGEGNNGTINGATYEPAQPRIPQLGMMNWSKGSNLYLNSEPTSNEAAAGDITYASYSWNYIGFKNATVFGDNSLTRFRYGGSVTLGLEYTLSAFVIMDDNSEPDITNTSSSGDFGIVLGNAVTGGTNTKTNVSGNIWRVSKTKTVSLTTTNNGIIKYTTQSSKGFKVVGWQLEESSSASAYRLTDGAATSNSIVIANPTIPTQDIFGNLVRDRLNSFNLDGSGYAEVADADSLNMSSGFSTSFWVKLDEGSTTTDYDFLVCKGRGISGFDATYGFGTTYYNNQLIATIYTSAAKNQLAYSNQNATGQWVFLCVTYEPNTTNGFILYIDKLNPISMTTSGTVDESHNLNVGRDSSFVTTRQSKNIISEVLFYDRALTSDEVENNYNAGLSAHTN